MTTRHAKAPAASPSSHRCRAAACVVLLLFAPAGLAQSDAEPPRPEAILALEAEGKHDEALRLWTELEQARPDDPFATRKKLDLLVRIGRFDAALDAGHRVLRRFAEDAVILEKIALASQRKAETLARLPNQRRSAQLYLQEAIRFGQRAFAADAQRRESLAIVGMAQFGLGEIEQALETAAQLVERFPDSVTGLLLRAQIRLMQFTSGIQEGTLDEEQRFRLAGEIRQDCERAIRIDATRHVPHRTLGDVAAWLGEHNTAVRHYADGLARDPERGAPHDWLRQWPAERRLALYRAALAAFTGLGQERPKDEALLQWYRGVAAYESGDWTQTREAMARCYSLEPEYVAALHYGALASYELRKNDEAAFFAIVLCRKGTDELIRRLRDAGPAQQRQLEIYRFLAKRALDAGDPAGSRDLNRCIAEAVDDADAWNDYAFLCRETQRFEESLRAYERALAVAPEDPQLLNDAAVILQYHLKRDLERAKAMYERAIRNAQRVLREKKGTPRELARAQQSLQDARGNLKELGAGKEPGPGK